LLLSGHLVLNNKEEQISHCLGLLSSFLIACLQSRSVIASGAVGICLN
jgi:hypothetical protein